MTFVTVNENRETMDRFVQILLSSFPGSAVYESTEPKNAIEDIKNKKIDAVFISENLEETEGLRLLLDMVSNLADTPVYVLSQDGEDMTDRWSDAAGWLVAPVTEEALKNALCG